MKTYTALIAMMLVSFPAHADSEWFSDNPHFPPLNPFAVQAQQQGTYDQWMATAAGAQFTPAAHPFTGDIMPLLKETKAKFPSSLARDTNDWVEPQDFAAKGGDCRSFASSAYFDLLSKGVSDERMALTVLNVPVRTVYHIDVKKDGQDTVKTFELRQHMVLVVDGKYVLDNLQDGVNTLKDYQREGYAFSGEAMNRFGPVTVAEGSGKPMKITCRDKKCENATIN